MRLIPIAGLALAGLMLSTSAFACDTIVPSQQISIHGPGKYCLSANRSLPIEISGPDIELDCRTRSIINPSPNGGGPTGIRINSGDKVIVRNCRVDGFPIGIDMNVQSNAQLLNNTVVRAQDVAIMVHGINNNDPFAEPTRIVGNRVIGYPNPNDPSSSWAPALRVIGLGRAVISNNVVAGHRGPVGLELVDSPDVQITNNQFLDPAAVDRMIRLEQSPRARVVHNTIMSRQQNVMFGLSGASGATCVENVFINTIHSGFSECAVTRYNVEQPLPPAP
ncbi:NosD domain-containing protein [Lysobacter capsici]|uniref:NosD domain-containing protein n=1 Tax=Lysobacter capsici TaxID=435897 RepID=UPI0006280E44|nr:right-handed parallel beta-helix repeat-containing protein [Lysobacter capsici]